MGHLNISVLTLFLVLVVLPSPAPAVPAAGQEQVVIQPDGAAFTAIIKGDEWNNWTETRSGHAISKSVDGTWYYVQQYSGNFARMSPVRADELPPPQIVPGLAPTAPRAANAPGVGFGTSIEAAPAGAFTGHVLLILVEFSNRSGTTSESWWGNNAQGKISDYYSKASYGRVDLRPASETFGSVNNGTVGWLNLGYRHPNTAAQTGVANQALTRDAILAADTYVNFASYDADNDGFVDADELAIVVVAAGFEAATEVATPSVWGHRWAISAVPAPVVDGVTVGADRAGRGGYAQFGEMHGSHAATMGVVVHELGHLIFGLPDLYDIDDSSSGIGAFGLMGNGTWGQAGGDANSGETPVLPTAWSQLDRGWVNAAEGSGTETVTAAGASGASSNNTVRRASTSVSKQYFLVQNRRSLGYDKGLERWLGTGFPGGLNIFHIDESQTGNSVDSRRLVDVEEADGVPLGKGPGTLRKLWYLGNATSFDNVSDPNSELNGGGSSGVHISGISGPGNVMSVTFDTGGGLGSLQGPVAQRPNGSISDRTPIFVWDAVPSADDYKVTVYDATGRVIAGWRSAAELGCPGGTGTCSLLSPVELATGDGHWKVKARNSNGVGPWSNTLNFTVESGGGGNGVPGRPSARTPKGIISNRKPTFTWDAVPSADDYKATVYDVTGRVITGWRSAAALGCAGGTGTCSLPSPAELAPGGGHWQVKARNANGVGPWSNTLRFTVQSGGGDNGVPGKPTARNPKGIISNRKPTFTWDAVPSADDYKATVYDVTGRVITGWRSAAELGCAGGTSTCSFQSKDVLATGSGYWQVKARNAQGVGPWSNTLNFTVSP